VKRDLLDPSHAERGESSLVLQAPEAPLDCAAPTVEVAESLCLVRDQRVTTVGLDPNARGRTGRVLVVVPRRSGGDDGAYICSMAVAFLKGAIIRVALHAAARWYSCRRPASLLRRRASDHGLRLAGGGGFVLWSPPVVEISGSGGASAGGCSDSASWTSADQVNLGDIACEYDAAPPTECAALLVLSAEDLDAARVTRCLRAGPPRHQPAPDRRAAELGVRFQARTNDPPDPR
jgi:hypothetical protein